MDISVIIPAHNEEKYIGPCIESLLAHKTENLKEIVVVDNASTDATANVARRFPFVRVVTEPEKGLTRARQKGLREATGDILAYVDADSRVAENWFEVLNREFGKDPSLVCLSGPCDYYDLSRGKRLFVRLYWLLLAMPVYFLVRTMVLGSNFAARRSALLAMDGFDTSIVFYGEDTNVARRLRAQGRVKFTPAFTQTTSARRLRADGLLRTACTYVMNFVSEFLLHRPLTRAYRDIR